MIDSFNGVGARMLRARCAHRAADPHFDTDIANRVRARANHLEGTVNHLEGSASHLEEKVIHFEGFVNRFEGKANCIEGKVNHFEGIANRVEGFADPFDVPRQELSLRADGREIVRDVRRRATWARRGKSYVRLCLNPRLHHITGPGCVRSLAAVAHHAALWDCGRAGCRRGYASACCLPFRLEHADRTSFRVAIL